MAASMAGGDLLWWTLENGQPGAEILRRIVAHDQRENRREERGQRRETEVEPRVAAVQLLHHRVAAGLGQNRRGTDGRNLRIAARAPDGVVEAVEWTGDSNWVTGVQWHPERMAESDPLSRRLFGTLIEVARKTAVKQA